MDSELSMTPDQFKVEGRIFADELQRALETVIPAEEFQNLGPSGILRKYPHVTVRIPEGPNAKMIYPVLLNKATELCFGTTKSTEEQRAFVDEKLSHEFDHAGAVKRTGSELVSYGVMLYQESANGGKKRNAIQPFVEYFEKNQEAKKIILSAPEEPSITDLE